MNKKSLLGHLIAVAVIVCGLIPRTALGGTNVPPHGSETTKPGPSARPGVANAQGVEVEFDSTRGQVTVRVSPRNLDGVTIPFPLREGLTVLENGVRQPGVSVVVEHSPITLGVLIENGGRSHQLNDWVSTDASMLLGLCWTRSIRRIAWACLPTAMRSGRWSTSRRRTTNGVLRSAGCRSRGSPKQISTMPR